MYLLKKYLNLRQVRRLEILKDYEMSTLYHLEKANFAANSLSRVSMGTVTHMVNDNKKLLKQVHKFENLGVRQEDSQI